MRKLKNKLGESGSEIGTLIVIAFLAGIALCNSFKNFTINKNHTHHECSDGIFCIVPENMEEKCEHCRGIRERVRAVQDLHGDVRRESENSVTSTRSSSGTLGSPSM